MYLKSFFKKISLLTVVLASLMLLVSFTTPAAAVDKGSDLVSSELPAPLVEPAVTIYGPRFVTAGQTYTWNATTNHPHFAVHAWRYGFSAGNYPYFLGYGDTVFLTIPATQKVYLEVMAYAPPAEEFIYDTHVLYVAQPHAIGDASTK